MAAIGTCLTDQDHEQEITGFDAGGRLRESWRVDEARKLKSERITDANRGELDERSTLTLREDAREWVTAFRIPVLM